MRTTSIPAHRPRDSPKRAPHCYCVRTHEPVPRPSRRVYLLRTDLGIRAVDLHCVRICCVRTQPHCPPCRARLSPLSHFFFSEEKFREEKYR